MKVRGLGMSVAMVLLAGACGGDPPGMLSVAPPASAIAQIQERQVIQRASMEVTVEELSAPTAQVAEMVSRVDGRVQSSRTSGDRGVTYVLRVPAASLAQVMAEVRLLGEVRREDVGSTDVTDEVSDLDARVQNLVAVRDRLRGYLEGAEGLPDILALETELARVQTEIDSINARLERLRGEVAMSQITVTINRKRRLGPLAKLGTGTAWLFKKLIFID